MKESKKVTITIQHRMVHMPPVWSFETIVRLRAFVLNHRLLWVESFAVRVWVPFVVWWGAFCPRDAFCFEFACSYYRQRLNLKFNFMTTDSKSVMLRTTK
jgi:hypothetical protein